MISGGFAVIAMGLNTGNQYTYPTWNKCIYSPYKVGLHMNTLKQNMAG